MPKYVNDPVVSKSTNGDESVRGTSNGRGVVGWSSNSVGVTGVGENGHGVYGETKSPDAAGLVGDGVNAGDGVIGITWARRKAAVFGFHQTEGPGVLGRGKPAGWFEGDVGVTGKLMVEETDLVEVLGKANRRIAALEEKVDSLRRQLESTIELLQHHLERQTLTH